MPPTSSSSSRPSIGASIRPSIRWLLVVLALIGLTIALGLHFGTRALKEKIAMALGPRAEISDMRVGFASIVVSGIRVRGDKDWPTAEELSAREVTITPDWNALLSRTVRISAIRIEDGYLSMLRRRDGKLALLPSLLDKPHPGGSPGNSSGQTSQASPVAPLPDIEIGHIVLENAAVDFFDASVRQPPHKLRLEQTDLRLGRIAIPALTGQTTIALDGVTKGVRQDGKVSIKGWVEIATRDSELKVRLTGVDLVAFQPYLVKAAETGVKRGTLDLELNATVKRKHLHAPGKVTLSGLELSGSSFMGMPRDALMRAMKNRDGRIVAEFALDGNVDDPKFSLNEKFMAQVGIAAAGALGISLADLVVGVGGAGGSAAQGLGSAMRKLFGETSSGSGRTAR